MATVENKTEEQSLGFLDTLKGIGLFFVIVFALIIVIGLVVMSAGLAVLMVGGVIVYYLDCLLTVLEKINKTLKE